MRHTLLLLTLLLSLPAGRAVAQSQQGAAASTDTLFRTIASLDSAMFDAYNRCDLQKLPGYFADDLEFYHDQTGLSRGRQSMVEAVKKNICGKVHRDLVAGTLEVYPLRGYGAMESGLHIFCDATKYQTCPDKESGIAKFVMLWENKGGSWQITRVISYDHVNSWQRGVKGAASAKRQ